MPLLLVAVALLSWPGARAWVVDFAPVYPAVFVIGVVQTWRFHHSRLLYAMVLLAMADRILLHYAAGEAAVAAGAGLVTFNVVSVLLPLNLFALAALPDRGPLTLRGIIHWVIIFVQPAVIVKMMQVDNAATDRVFSLMAIQQNVFGWSEIPAFGLLIFAIAFIFSVGRLIWEANVERRSFVWMLVASFLAFRQGHAGLDSTSYLAVAGLIIVVGVIDTSYRLAFQDALTGLPTRRGFFETISGLMGAATIAMVDVDHFKQFNDKHGHDVGDQVLKMVAAELARVSGGGKPFRYGGEEFAVVFDGKRVEDSQPHLEKLRATIAGKVFTVRGPNRPLRKPTNPKPVTGRKTLKVTVSIGAADNTNTKETIDDVIKAADEALYRAKETGRNKVLVRARPRI